MNSKLWMRSLIFVICVCVYACVCLCLWLWLEEGRCGNMQARFDAWQKEGEQRGKTQSTANVWIGSVLAFVFTFVFAFVIVSFIAFVFVSGFAFVFAFVFVFVFVIVIVVVFTCKQEVTFDWRKGNRGGGPLMFGLSSERFVSSTRLADLCHQMSSALFVVRNSSEVKNQDVFFCHRCRHISCQSSWWGKLCGSIAKCQTGPIWLRHKCLCQTKFRC